MVCSPSWLCSERVVHDLPRLTDAERALFDELRDNRIRKGLRLEQEACGLSVGEGSAGQCFRGGE